jgi:hypothetical protein
MPLLYLSGEWLDVGLRTDTKKACAEKDRGDPHAQNLSTILDTTFDIIGVTYMIA